MKYAKPLVLPLVLALLCSLITGCSPSNNNPSIINPSDSTPSDPQTQNPPAQVTRYLPVEIVRYDSKGELWYRRTCTYDEKGRLLLYSSQNAGEGSHTNSYTYTYNEQGHLTSIVHQDGDFTDRQTYTYTYNPDGSVASYQSSLSTSIFAFTYDDQGRVLSRTTFKEDGTQSSSITCSYDELGQLTQLTKEFPNIYTFTYDDHGNLTNLDGGIYRIAYKYDQQNNRLSDRQDLNLYGWDYQYTNGQLTGITFMTNLDYDETKAREYVLNPDGSVASIQWHGGGRTEYTYVSVTLTQEEALQILPAWNAANEPLILADYCQNPLAYLLPHPDHEMGDLY